MLVKKSDILKIEMVDRDILSLLNEKIERVENNFCVRFHLKSDGHITLPCFYSAGFELGEYPESDKKQLRLTQEYLDQYPDDAYVELNSSILYNMNVYH